MKNSSKVLLALLGGVALGALVGVLLAPDKGSETRKKIKEKAKDLSDKAKDKFRERMKNANGVPLEEEEVDEYI